MKDYRKIQAWQRSHALAVESHRLTKLFPREKIFGLTSQMRRAATSIPANIVEGGGRDGDAELKRFATIALGSIAETDAKAVAAQLLEVRRMIGVFSRKRKADR